MVELEYRGEGDAAPCCGATDLMTVCAGARGFLPSMRQVPTMPQAQHAIWALAHGATIQQASACAGIVSTVVGSYARDLGLVGPVRD